MCSTVLPVMLYRVMAPVVVGRIRAKGFVWTKSIFWIVLQLSIPIRFIWGLVIKAAVCIGD